MVLPESIDNIGLLCLLDYIIILIDLEQYFVVLLNIVSSMGDPIFYIVVHRRTVGYCVQIQH